MNPRPLVVVICTHRPRRDFLEETLRGLREQTWPAEQWRLLIVDNASPEPVAGWLDLSWHPAAETVVEPQLGTAHARRRALEETRDDELLLFVDDDNVLDPDYLAVGLARSAQRPRLGGWGGQCRPRYEAAPPAWFAPFAKYLAIFEFTAPMVATRLTSYEECPPTAGAFIRRAVRERYLDLVAQDPRRLTLGAKGDTPVRGEDLDLMLTAFDLGLELARFPELRLTHLIPAGRVELHYVAKLVEGTVFGTHLLAYLREGKVAPMKPNLLQRLAVAWRAWRLPDVVGSIYRAEERGSWQAANTIRQWHRNP